MRGHLLGLSGDAGELRHPPEPSGTLSVTLELKRPSYRLLR